MAASQPHPMSENGAGPGAAAPAGAAGPAGAESRSAAVRPFDRSYMLRRTPRSSCAGEEEGEGGIRIRRARRVYASFRGIPALSRNGGR